MVGVHGDRERLCVQKGLLHVLWLRSHTVTSLQPETDRED